MHFFAILSNLRLQDGLDILFLTVFAYHLYLWFRGTKAFKALVGLLVLGIVFTVSRSWGLFLTTWVFQIFWQVLVILLIILFQSEIRQVLERVNPLGAIGLRKHSLPEKWVKVFSEATFSLAERKIGALMIIELADRVDELITGGRTLEGDPNRELLMSIFQEESLLHDGALLIRDGRIVQVACYLPLSSTEGLPEEWGTRHRAAIGLTERCDALVVVVSEERGEVSLAREGELLHMESFEKLSRHALEATAPLSPQKSPLRERARSLLLNRLPAKAGAVTLVSVLWLLLAGQQDVEVTLNVPLELKNVPSRMEIMEPVNPEVRIKVRGLRKDASILSEKNVRAEIDLSAAGIGKTEFPISRDHIGLPNDRVHVINIDPSQMAFKFKQL
jgi:uncharacterized protein (TIGR00159 family)